ncbi:MAG: Uma2 family endonuclease [Chloroflexi bacterium]|nr:Uma2 family endonuclease [Chloroflexota bacterium]
MTQVARSPRPEPVLTPSDSPEYVATARMTWDEWLDWDYEGGLTEWLDEWLDWDYEGGLTEWLDGEVHIYMSNTDEHQRIVGFLSALLLLYGQSTSTGVVRTGGYALQSAQGHAGREPDLMFIGAGKLPYKQSRFMSAAPDILIEVISEDSVRRDRTIKLLEYQELGVPEYWLIDSRPGQETAEFYLLEGQRYRAVEPEEGIYYSVVLPGFWLRTEWLWAADTSVLAAFREITAS